MTAIQNDNLWYVSGCDALANPLQGLHCRCEMLAPVTYWGDVWYATH